MNDQSFFQHKARKRFGQNFLIDHGVIRQIVRSISPRTSDNIVEIGPGQGAITASLLEACPKLDVVELDRNLIPKLRVKFDHMPGFTIHNEDALKFDFASLLDSDNNQLRIVGNLPYNISTPLIFHLLSYRERVEDMHFMLQKEVVLRLAAKSGDKNYGRLSVMAQYSCAIEALFEVPPECFDPAPKVTSAIVRLTPFSELPHIASDTEHFSAVVKQAFHQRRKTLRNTLKPMLESVDIDQLGINMGLRAEQLSVGDFVQLSNTLLKLTS